MIINVYVRVCVYPDLPPVQVSSVCEASEWNSEASWRQSETNETDS